MKSYEQFLEAFYGRQEVRPGPQPRPHPLGTPRESDSGPVWASGSLSGWAPTAGWHSRPATADQVATLKRRGYCPPDDVTKGEAWRVLSQPTVNMIRTAKRYGLYQSGMDFTETWEAINRSLNGGNDR